jgi:hypothetical protein
MATQINVREADGQFWVDIRVGDLVEERRGPYPDGATAARSAGICRALFPSGVELYDSSAPLKRRQRA